MSDVFWDKAIIAIFFFYGLAFYSLGLALFVESGRASQLQLARSMRLLAGFGVLHGTHEWIDMFEREVTFHYQEPLPGWLLWLRLALLTTSFIALIAFGEHLLTNRSMRRDDWRITISVVSVHIGVAFIVYNMRPLPERDTVRMLDVLARYFLGLPGAVLACWALWQQRPVFRNLGVGNYVRELTVAAVALLIYGLVGQVFISKTILFPSTYINAELFQEVFGFPIQLVRALMAMAVAISMIRVLRALEVESRQRILAAERAKQEAERRSRDELARLNAQLQIAHEETKRLLREVQRRDALRGELLQQITTAQENERRRIARELHDGTGQTLTGLALGLRGIASLLECDNDKLAHHLSELEAMATTSLGELRLLINDLRPPQLDDMGLVSAVRWMVDNFNRRSELQTAFEFEVVGEPYPLPPEVEITLFRIAQEGLNNIVKHAQAVHAKVTVDFADGVRLTVTDDGIGFDPEVVVFSEGPREAWGLVGMQERAGLIDARLVLESAPGQGTTLTIQLELAKEREHEHGDTRADR